MLQIIGQEIFCQLNTIDVYKRQDERYPENNLDTILTDDPLNDSLIEEIKSIPGVKMCIRDRYLLWKEKSLRNQLSPYSEKILLESLQRLSLIHILSEFSRRFLCYRRKYVR